MECECLCPGWRIIVWDRENEIDFFYKSNFFSPCPVIDRGSTFDIYHYSHPWLLTRKCTNFRFKCIYLHFNRRDLQSQSQTIKFELIVFDQHYKLHDSDIEFVVCWFIANRTLRRVVTYMHIRRTNRAALYSQPQEYSSLLKKVWQTIIIVDWLFQNVGGHWTKLLFTM